MKIPTERLRTLIPVGKQASLEEVNMQGKKIWFVRGEIEGMDFSIPASYETVCLLLGEYGPEVAKEVTKVEKGRARKGASKTPPSKPPPTPTNKPNSKFTPPNSPVKNPRRQRLSAEGKVLLERFKVSQGVKKGSRRNPDQVRDIEIAKSYLLEEDAKVVLRWIKHNNELCS